MRLFAARLFGARGGWFLVARQGIRGEGIAALFPKESALFSPVLSFCPSCLALVPFDTCFDKLVVCLTLASVRYELSGCDSLIREGASGRAPLAGALRGPSLADSRQFWNVRILIEDDG